MLLTWTSLIGQFVHSVEGEGMGGDRYFSHLQVKQFTPKYSNLPMDVNIRGYYDRGKLSSF